jgi:hypothetical protein
MDGEILGIISSTLQHDLALDRKLLDRTKNEIIVSTKTGTVGMMTVRFER